MEGALYYAAGRAYHTSGRIVLLYVIEPDNQFWEGVRQVQLEEQTNKAKALFRLLRRKMANEGFDAVPVEEVIREGKKVEEILQADRRGRGYRHSRAGRFHGDRGARAAGLVARRWRDGRQVPDPDHHRAGRAEARGHQGPGLRPEV